MHSPSEPGAVAPPQSSPAATPGVPSDPNPRPLVFGKYAFAICFVPYMIYLVGTSTIGYFDTARAHGVLQRQRHKVAEIVGRGYDAALNNQSDPAGRSALEKELPFESFHEHVTMKEELDPEKIEEVTAPFLADDSPIPLEYRTAAREELDFLYELHDSDKKHLYREVLEKGYQRNAKLHPDEIDRAASRAWFPNGRTWYPTLYFLTVLSTAAAMLVVFPGYFKADFNFSWLSILVGTVGIVVWIGLWKLDAEYLHFFNKIEARAAFNPFDELKENPQWMWMFIGIRLFGLVLVVPIVEEFFLRGWLMRYIDDPDWDEVPLGTAGHWALLGVLIYAVVTHPAEAIAAIVWFGMVTWLYLRTKSIWNCVIAHLVTNLLLGVYVLSTRSWALW